MTDRYDEQTVLAYIEGDLPEAEAHAFKLKMLTDTELRSLVDGLESDRATLRTLPLEQPPIDLMDVVNDQLERQLLLGGDADEVDRKTGHRRLRFARVGSYLALAAMFILGVGLLYQAMIDMTGEAKFNDRGLVAFRDVQRAGDDAASEAAAQLPDKMPEITAADAAIADAEGGDSGGDSTGQLPQLAMARKSTAANKRMALLKEAPTATPEPTMRRARVMDQENSQIAKLKDAPEAFGALALQASPPPPAAASGKRAEAMAPPSDTDADKAMDRADDSTADIADLKVAEAMEKDSADEMQLAQKSAQTLAQKVDAVRMAGVSATTIDPLQAAAVIAEAAPADAAVGVDGIAKTAESAAIDSSAIASEEKADVFRENNATTVTMASPPAPIVTDAPQPIVATEVVTPQTEAITKGEAAAVVSAIAPQTKPVMPPVASMAPRELTAATKRQENEAEAEPTAILPQRLTVLLDTDDMERTFGRIALWAARHKVAMQAGQSNEAMDTTAITVVISPDKFRVLLNSLARDKRHTARIASSDTDKARSELMQREGDDASWRNAATWLKEKNTNDSFALDDDGLMAVPIIIRKK